MGCSRSSSTVVVSPSKQENIGRVLIKSIKFKASYSKNTRDLHVATPENVYTVSELVWNNLSYTLTDKVTINTDTNVSYSLPEIPLRFTVNSDNSFKALENIDEVASLIEENQKSEVSEKQRGILLKSIKKECVLFWKLIKELWIDLEPSLVRTDLTHCTKKCVSISFAKNHDKGELEDYLRKTVGVNEFFNLERGHKVKGILEKESMRPHVVNFRNFSLLNAKSPQGKVVEVEEDIRSLIFCWEDIPLLNSEDLVKNEQKVIKHGSAMILAELREDMRQWTN